MGQIVHYNGANLYRCASSKGDMRLIPGNNDVPQEIWNEVKSHPLVLARIKNGTITPKIVSSDKGSQASSQAEGKGSEEPSSLGQFSAKDAEAMVKDTFELDTLERWKSEETRKGVLKVIDAQIAELQPPKGSEKDN